MIDFIYKTLKLSFKFSRNRPLMNGWKMQKSCRWKWKWDWEHSEDIIIIVKSKWNELPNESPRPFILGKQFRNLHRICCCLAVMSCTDMPRPPHKAVYYLAPTMGDKLYAMTKIYHNGSHMKKATLKQHAKHQVLRVKFFPEAACHLPNRTVPPNKKKKNYPPSHRLMDVAQLYDVCVCVSQDLFCFDRCAFSGRPRFRPLLSFFARLIAWEL